jgi:quercetin dioxygenase-like cupin family protein
MGDIFPEPLRRLPQAEIPVSGVEAYLSQADTHQILFMRFAQDAEVAAHSHEAQWGIVLEGRIELTVGGVTRTYGRGERYFIERGVPHSARIFSGYADITFFDQPSRYRVKKER